MKRALFRRQKTATPASAIKMAAVITGKPEKKGQELIVQLIFIT
jgi:hypothetical protein